MASNGMRLVQSPIQRGSPNLLPKGFTLIELMIAVVIVAILMAIVVPSYAEYVRRANRASAKAALAEFMARQESWRADRKAFASAISDLGYPVAGAVSYLGRDGSPQSVVTNAVYRLEVTTTGSPSAFQSVRAIPIAGQASDKCGTLVIAASGAKSVTGASTGWDAGKCWKS